MSSAKARLRASSVIALPPYFTTTTWPWYCFSHGRAPASDAGRGTASEASRLGRHEEYALFSWT